MTKLQRAKWVCHLNNLISAIFPQNSPIKTYPDEIGIRGVRSRLYPDIAGTQSTGVMKIVEVTPFIPLTLRGKCKGRDLILRGRFKEI